MVQDMSLPKAIPESEWELFLKEIEISGIEGRQMTSGDYHLFTDGEDEFWKYQLWTQVEKERYMLVPDELPKNVREAERINEPTWFLTHSSAEPV